jgi:flagellar basal-body rod modification protein FlgD
MVDVTSIQQTTPQADSTAKSPTQTLGQDQFLNLLVAQLKNQDPLKPVDNEQFIAELAQFSQLEQTKQMTTSFQKFIDTQTAANNQALVSLIGANVAAAGSTVALTPGTSAPLTYQLAGDATSVLVKISNAAGVPVRTLTMGSQAAGVQTVLWDGRDDLRNPLAQGQYSFAVSASAKDNVAVSATTMQTGTVTGVNYQDGAPKLLLNTGQTIAPAQIMEIR